MAGEIRKIKVQKWNTTSQINIFCFHNIKYQIFEKSPASVSDFRFYADFSLINFEIADCVLLLSVDGALIFFFCELEQLIQFSLHSASSYNKTH
jgi:hypothetical protein